MTFLLFSHHWQTPLLPKATNPKQSQSLQIFNFELTLATLG
jgi:hypothetical protein